MKLDKLVLMNWGALRSGEYPMGSMTLLTGPTGSGKSTMLDALQTVMTAAHQNLFSYNPGQDETNQGTRNGKTKRTLWSYIVGAEDNLFARPEGAHGYIAAVFKPSEGEQGKDFTALIGAAARIDGSGDRRLAVQERLALVIVDDAALTLEDLASVTEDGEYQVVAVEKIESHLKAKYRQTINFHDSKREYLCQLYGRFRGKTSVSFPEAELAAKAWSQSISHKPIGSVDELVKVQILEHDPQELSQRISQISDLMRQMHNLRVEGERLDANVSKLEHIDDSIRQTTSNHESAVQYQLFASRQSLRDDERQVEESVNASIELGNKIRVEEGLIKNLKTEKKGYIDSQISIVANLRGIPAAEEKRRIQEKLEAASVEVRKASVNLASALEAADRLQSKAQQIIGMEFPASSHALESAASNVAEALAASGKWPLSVYRDKAIALGTSALKPREAYQVIRDVEKLEGKFEQLHKALAGTQEGFISAVQQKIATLSVDLGKCEEEEKKLAVRKANLADGGTDYPNEVSHALRVFKADLSGARVQVLCDLIEPVSEEWQPAIEGYMAKARFNLIVDEDWESKAVDFVRQRSLRAKVIQGSLCLQHAKPNQVPTSAIIHELRTDHPTAKAYLVEQYGQVVKVNTTEELRHTSRGVMKDGKASGSRTMFVAEVSDLVFGKEAQRIAREKVIKAHLQAEEELNDLRKQVKSLRALLSLLGDVKSPSFASTTELEKAVRDIEASQADLGRLDLTEVSKLEAEKDSLGVLIDSLEEKVKKADKQIGKHEQAIIDFERHALRLQQGIPGKEQRVDGDIAEIKKLCVVNGTLSFTTLEQGVDDLLDGAPISSQQIQDSIRKFGEHARESHGDVREALANYNRDARTDEQLHMVHGEGQRSDDFGPIYEALIALRKQVKGQLDVQREIGLRQNLDKLRTAADSFKDVFTKQFCYEVRNSVDTGVKTLRALNVELEKLKFGSDKFHIDWSVWVPEYKEYYDFFSAAYEMSEAQESGDLFGESDLSPENCQIRDKLAELLLSNDQERALKELQRIADYRNYRRYEIWKESDTGSRVPLSEWGTGSGGQLETPAYIIRAAVVTNRLKHFDKGINLKMLVNDESFARMDERRAHDVIKFIRDSLGIQLICAMPTKHAGAIKSEFTKEWSFTRTEAVSNGEVDFISEADERDLNQDKLRALWDARRQQVRLQAQIAFEAEEEAKA